MMTSNRGRRLAVLSLATIGCCLLVGGTCRRGASAADMVLLNGTIITVDSADRIAQAVAIKEGRIIAVGTTAEIQAHAGPGTQIVDLKGATATPGLIDAHLHFSVGGVRRLFNIELSYPAVRRIADVRDSTPKFSVASRSSSAVVCRCRRYSTTYEGATLDQFLTFQRSVANLP